MLYLDIQQFQNDDDDDDDDNNNNDDELVRCLFSFRDNGRVIMKDSV